MSNPIGVSAVPTIRDYFILYPNPVPAGGELNYKKSDNQPFRFSLFDLTGKQVSSQYVDGQTIKLPEELSQGIYLYLAELEDRIYKGRIFVK